MAFLLDDIVITDAATSETLKIAVEAGKKYVFSATLRCGSTAGGIRVGLNAPAGSNVNYNAFGQGATRTSILYCSDQNVFSAVNGSAAYQSGTNSLGLIKMDGEIHVGSTGGYLTILFSSATGISTATAYAMSSKLSLTTKQ